MSARSHAESLDRNWDSLQFRLIFALSFAVYLFAALGARLKPAFWRGAASHRSIFAEAWEASGTTAQLAFAG